MIPFIRMKGGLSPYQFARKKSFPPVYKRKYFRKKETQTQFSKKKTQNMTKARITQIWVPKSVLPQKRSIVRGVTGFVRGSEKG